MSRGLPDNVVLDGIVRKLLTAPARRAIRACAKAGYGEARDLKGILAAAKKHGARPLVVAAALGYLPDARSARRYVDVLKDDEGAMGLLPKDEEVAAAFALSRAAHPEGCAFVVE